MFRSNKKVWKYIFTFDGNTQLLTYLLLIEMHNYFYGNTYLPFMEIHNYLYGNTYLLLIEIHNYLYGNTFRILMEIHIYLYGNTYLLLVHLEGLHLLLLSSGPVDCSDQKGIDDPFSELIDIERHLFRFRISSCGGNDDDPKSKTPTQINLYRFCTAARWKNNLMKNGTSRIYF